MKDSMESGRRSFKPPFLMLTILGIHVAAAGFFMMMSGCSTTKQTTVEPPPAPIMPPKPIDESVTTAMPRPGFRPPVAVERAPESFDAAGASSYSIQKGDSLSKVAARAGVSVREIQELNNISDPNKIRIGQKILLPAHAKSLPSSSAASSSASKSSAKSTSKSSAPAKASGDSHTVQPGDTLGKLASRYGTSVAAFKSVNNLKSDTIRIGQKLSIPNGKVADKAASTTASSDAPAPSAAEPAPALEAAPAVTAPAVVDAPAAVEATDAVASESDAETPFPYTVKDGDTLDSIAIKFSARKDVIMRLNGLTSESISPGQKLLIPWQ